MSLHRIMIVLTMAALIGLSGCQVRFKASEVEYEGQVKDTTYNLNGFAFYNPLEKDTPKTNVALGDK